MFYSHNVAVAAYQNERKRLPVQLSPAARAYRQRNLSTFGTAAGLAEVQAEFDYKPLPAFVLAPLGLTNDDVLRDTRKMARKVQEAKELRARLVAEGKISA